MLTRFLFIACLMGSLTAPLQGQIGWFPRLFNGVPSGSCSSADIAIDTTTGKGYFCNGGTFVAAGSAGTVTNTGGALTSNAIVLGAGGSDTKVSTAFTTDGASIMSIGVAGGGNGSVQLSGNTSGHADFTAPAVAGTRTNPVTMTNVLLGPNGSASSATYGFGTGTNGLYSAVGVGPVMTVSGSDSLGFATNEVRLLSTGRVSFCPSTTMNCTIDTGISRDAIGVVDVGNGVAGNTTGKIKASAHIVAGTKFTTNNGCTDSATAGGATAGTFTVGSTSCTEVVTMGDSATAPNGWSCTVVDITTLADATNPHQTTSTTTTATFVTGTVVSGDKIQFSCIGY